MAVEMVAGAFLSVAFEKLFERFASPELGKSSVGYNIKQLEDKLKKAMLLLDDAEDKQVIDRSVKAWLDDLKHVVFRADDLADEIKSMNEKKSIMKSVAGAIKSVYHSGVEKRMISRDLDKLMARAPALGFTTPLPENDHVFGRNDDKDKIFQLLLSDDICPPHRIGVLPIAGMGGVGKTSLAKLVYDDTRLKERGFELRAWVTVSSTDFDIYKIMKSILQQLNPDAFQNGVVGPMEIERLVKEALRDKRFLFVLDDVLYIDFFPTWNSLISNFVTGDNSESRIIVTTRYIQIVSMVNTGPIYHVNPGSNDDCWRIFASHTSNWPFSRKLKKASLLLHDAEYMELSDLSAMECLEELKHVVFRADDLAAQIKSKKSIRKLVTGAFKSLYHSPTRTIHGEIDMISRDLDTLLDRVSVLGLEHNDGSQNKRSNVSPISISPMREESQVYGRSGEKEEILKMLLSNEICPRNQIGVLPIVGMGGLGKTTLAHLIYNDPRVKECGFELRAWVTVSTEFDASRIMKAILKQVNPQALQNGVDEPTELQWLVKEALRGKRFLFILDDVWDENYDNWDLLMSTFTTGDNSGSRIIVTTCSRKVGLIVKNGPIYELKQVSFENCWEIFVCHAFNRDSNVDSRLKEIGTRIVEKCKGVPLAVKSVGGLLRSERNHERWQNVLNSHVWEWSGSPGYSVVLPSLWLSYHYLPSSLKQCFAYCSLFPQDYEFEKEKLILLWMAEGFLKGEKPEEVGGQYFDVLVSSSLLQRSSQRPWFFVMHDLVHDMAAFVSGEFCFRFENKSTKLTNLTTRTRHISLGAADHNALWDSISNTKHLSTFITGIYYSAHSHDLVEKLITKGRLLRVLSLKLVEATKSHYLLGELNNLRHLDLSGSEVEEISSSVCSLRNLQSLLLSNCNKLTWLPTELGKLINLRHLDISNSWIQKMPPKMGDLKELRTLTDFVLGCESNDGENCSSIKELGKLRHLAGKLRISGLQNAYNVEDVRSTNLGDKADLKELVLEWSDDAGTTTSTDMRRAKDVIDAMRPHANLAKLEIHSYPSSSFPIWLGDCSSLNSLDIWNCQELTEHHADWVDLERLTSLTGLSVYECERELESFPKAVLPLSLTSFKLNDFLQLKSLNGRAFERVESLKRLVLYECNELVDLPKQVVPASLGMLWIQNCCILEERYNRETGKDRHIISHIPDIHISGYKTDELSEMSTKACGGDSNEITME